MCVLGEYGGGVGDVSEDRLRELAWELLEAEEAYLWAPTMDNLGRLARARRRMRQALGVVGDEARRPGDAPYPWSRPGRGGGDRARCEKGLE